MSSQEDIRTACCIEDFPTELLIRIFVLGAEDEHPKKGYRWELAVSWVCRRWREIALDVSALWTHIECTESSPYTKALAYLARSKDAPLHFLMQCFTRWSSDSDWKADQFNRAKLILELMLPLVPRLRSIKLITDDFACKEYILTSLSQIPAAPTLEDLQLTYLSQWFTKSGTDPKVALFQDNAPKLQALNLRGFSLGWSQSPSLQKGLTELTIGWCSRAHKMSFVQLISVLRECPYLQSLSVSESISRLPQDFDEAVQPAELTHLTKLRLEFAWASSIAEIVRHLFLPILSDLEFSAAGDRDMESYAAFYKPHPLLRRPILDTVEVLTIRPMCGDTSTRDMQAVRTMCAALVLVRDLNLTVEGIELHAVREQLGPWVEEWSRCLSGLDPDFPLPCPQLHTLRIMGRALGPIRNIVEARAGAGFPLKRVYVDRPDVELLEADKSSEEWLRAHLDRLEYVRCDPDMMPELEMDDEDVWRYRRSF